MKIAFIGGGYSSCISAIMLKKQHYDFDIVIFESNNDILKKLSVTGNGRCNINNISDDVVNFNDECVKYLLDKYPLKKQTEALKSLGIYLTQLNSGCLYPISLSSENITSLLKQQLKVLDINIKCNCFIKDYFISNEKIIIVDNDNNKYIFDKIVFSNGSIAYPKLGCDKSLLDVFKSHKYIVKPFISGLCPIRVKENVKSLFGVRIKCQVNVYNNANLEFSQYGEVIFKKDGLSGIVIFNSTIKSFLNSNNLYTICLDILPKDLDINDLYTSYLNQIDPLYSLIPAKIIEYVYHKLNVNVYTMDYDKLLLLVKTLHDLKFTFDCRYPFNESQICLGGVDIININLDTMESNIEKNVYFIGEILSLKGISGGFNLKLCLIESLNLIDNIKAN